MPLKKAVGGVRVGDEEKGEHERRGNGRQAVGCVRDRECKGEGFFHEEVERLDGLGVIEGTDVQAIEKDEVSGDVAELVQRENGMNFVIELDDVDDVFGLEVEIEDG